MKTPQDQSDLGELIALDQAGANYLYPLWASGAKAAKGDAIIFVNSETSVKGGLHLLLCAR